MTHPGDSECVLVPREPTIEMLWAIVDVKWPQDWEVGKKLQRERGLDVVPPKTELEIAVGQYQRLLAAAPAQPSSWHRIDDPVNPALEKRPVAFRCRDQHGWVLFEYEDVAARYAESLGLEYEGLYARSAPLTKDPRP